MSFGSVPIAMDIMYRMKPLIEIHALRLWPASTNLSPTQQKKLDLDIPIKASCTERPPLVPELPNALESINAPNTMANPHTIIISPFPPSTPHPIPHHYLPLPLPLPLPHPISISIPSLPLPFPPPIPPLHPLSNTNPKPPKKSANSFPTNYSSQSNKHYTFHMQMYDFRDPF